MVQAEALHRPVALTGAQVRPHPPQLLRSVANPALAYSQPFVKSPSQSLKPPAQVPIPQTLVWQVGVVRGAAQAVVQLPQVSGSEDKLCCGLATAGQLSTESSTPSPSVSGPYNTGAVFDACVRGLSPAL